MKLSVVLPVYNEEESLNFFLPQLISILDKKTSIFEILIIDDNSTDNTKNIVDNIGKSTKNNVKYILRNEEPSLPKSILLGIKSSEFENIMWLDADGSMSAESVGILIDKFKQNTQHIIIGSRFVKGGGYKGVKENKNSIFSIFFTLKGSKDSILGMIASNLFNYFLNLINNIDVKDLTSGFIILKKAYIEEEPFYKSQYGEYFIYLLKSLKNKQLTIKEVGYICLTRKYGKSKTAPNIFKLFQRGFPYILATISIRKK